MLDFKENSHEAAQVKAESIVAFRSATHVRFKAQLICYLSVKWH